MSQASAPESHADKHASFIKTPKQLIVVIMLAFVVPIVGIALVLQMVVGGRHAESIPCEPCRARRQRIFSRPSGRDRGSCE